MFAELFTPEQLTILGQIIFIDLVLAGDNAIIIGMVASKFPVEQRKKVIFWGIGGAVILRIILTMLDCILATDNWLKVNWRIITSLYCLQTLCRCDQRTI
jgi:predicted tellurium resistance membrane protein TerC